MKKLIAVLGLGVLFMSFVQGKTISVAKSGGDYTTISAGVNAASAGDVVEVGAGTFSEKVTSARAGNSSAWITIKSATSRTAKISGAEINHGYVRLQGFESSSGIVVKTSNVEILDNYVNSHTGTAFSLSGRPPYTNHHVTFKGNRAYKCGYGAVIAGNDVLFENNEIERIFKYSSSGDADYTRVFGERVTIRGNYFHSTLHEEIGNAHLDIVQVFTNNGEYNRHMLIENNIFCDAHQGLMSSNVKATDTGYFTVQNNIYNRMWAWGILGWDVTDFTVYNNLFANMTSWGCKFTGASKNNVVKNNIFFFCKENSYFAENGATVTGDYNMTYVSFNPPNPGPNDLLVKYPDFVDWRNDDFHLNPTSLCIDNGTDVGLTYDLEGNPRPHGNGFDIGPYEFQGATGLKGIKFNNPYFEKYCQKELPNPLKADMVHSMTLRQGIKWYNLAGQPLHKDEITDGVYLVNSMLIPGLRKLVVIK